MLNMIRWLSILLYLHSFISCSRTETRKHLVDGDGPFEADGLRHCAGHFARSQRSRRARGREGLRGDSRVRVPGGPQGRAGERGRRLLGLGRDCVPTLLREGPVHGRVGMADFSSDFGPLLGHCPAHLPAVSGRRRRLRHHRGGHLRRERGGG